MWSGPRNISTALMRSFGNRNDTFVSDEPLYANYLARTGYDHPGREEILASQSQDFEQVLGMLLGEVPGGKSIWYQKHMAHHLPEDLSAVPLSRYSHVMLIRDPIEMLTSLLKVIPKPTARQTGLPQQLELLDQLNSLGVSPPVLDSRDVLMDPQRLLSKLCERLGIEFQEGMLAWPSGCRETDGIWAKHWYGNVIQSTGFSPYKSKGEAVPPQFQEVLAQCQQAYNRLYEQRLK